MTELSEADETTDKKQRIVDTAKRLFFEMGFANTSINRIQEEAEISKGLIYYHFENKDDLALTVLDSIFFEEFREFEGLKQSLKDIGDRSQIVTFLDTYLSQLFSSTMQDQSTIQIIIDLLLNLDSTESKQKVRDIYLTYIGKIAEFLEFLGVEHPIIHSKLIVSVLDGLMYLNMALGEGLSDEDTTHVIRALKCMINLEAVL